MRWIGMHWTNSMWNHACKPLLREKCSTFGMQPKRDWILLTVFFFSFRAWCPLRRWVAMFSSSDCYNKQVIMGRSEIGKFYFHGSPVSSLKSAHSCYSCLLSTNSSEIFSSWGPWALQGQTVSRLSEHLNIPTVNGVNLWMCYFWQTLSSVKSSLLLPSSLWKLLMHARLALKPNLHWPVQRGTFSWMSPEHIYQTAVDGK